MPLIRSLFRLVFTAARAGASMLRHLVTDHPAPDPLAHPDPCDPPPVTMPGTYARPHRQAFIADLPSDNDPDGLTVRCTVCDRPLGEHRVAAAGPLRCPDPNELCA